MALIREIWIGSERGYQCKISRAFFSKRQAALHHANEIIKRQTLDGVPVGEWIKQRRKIYKKSLPVMELTGRRAGRAASNHLPTARPLFKKENNESVIT